MYSSAAKAKHFQTITGSSSTRAKSNGSCDAVPNRGLVDANCKEQLRTLQANRGAVLWTLRELTDGDEIERTRRVVADLDRQIGHIYKLIEGNSRARFEEIFVSVAQLRLPKSAFLELVEESREYWRREGAIADVPPGSARHRNKLKKRACERLART